MTELLAIGILTIVLTLFDYQLGALCQKKFRLPIFNPILIGMIIVILTLKVTGLGTGEYQQGVKLMSWLMTPATVCLAIPMYEQLSILKKNWKAILAGIAVGTVASLAMVLLCCVAMGFGRELTVSLLPKSVTSAIGVPLSQLSGGIGAITTPVIIITGIIANILADVLFRLLRITDPVARGVALGTSGHVIATSRANELGPLNGAVSSLSLAMAGILTAVLFPLALMLL